MVLRRVLAGTVLTVTLTGGGFAAAPESAADAVAYLVNVTVRPGYNFPSADAALAYGNGICEQVRRTGPSSGGYSAVVGQVKDDFATDDDYQAAYLINQAVNELCPALIWQLRNSAAHYTGGPVLGG